MQGSKTSHVVAVAFAASLGGCIVHNHPPTPAPQSAQPQPQQPAPQAQPRAQAVPSARPAPAAPATRKAATPAPAPAPQQPPPTPPQPQPAATGRTYTIKPGDNLWNISKEVYGDGTKYQRILDANPGLNPDNMKPGTKIVIP